MTAPEAGLHLYHGDRTRSLRVRWVLEELGLPYTLHPVLFPARVRQPEYLDENPLGSLPLLVDGAVRLTESMAICEHLVQRHGPTPLDVRPDEPGHPAYRQFCWFGEAGLMPPVGVLLTYGFMTPPAERPTKVLDAARLTLHRRAEAVRAALTDADHLAAGRFTLADVSVGYALELAALLGEGGAYPPEVVAYLKRLAARPAHQRASALVSG